MSEQQTSHRETGVTMTEAVLWIVFGISAAIYVIAFVVLNNLGYGDDPEPPAGWMSFAGMIAGLTVVPAIILTGLRELLNARLN